MSATRCSGKFKKQNSKNWIKTMKKEARNSAAAKSRPHIGCNHVRTTMLCNAKEELSEEDIQGLIHQQKMLSFCRTSCCTQKFISTILYFQHFSTIYIGRLTLRARTHFFCLFLRHINPLNTVLERIILANEYQSNMLYEKRMDYSYVYARELFVLLQALVSYFSKSDYYYEKCFIFKSGW